MSVSMTIDAIIAELTPMAAIFRQLNEKLPDDEPTIIDGGSVFSKAEFSTELMRRKSDLENAIAAVEPKNDNEAAMQAMLAVSLFDIYSVMADHQDPDEQQQRSQIQRLIEGVANYMVDRCSLSEELRSLYVGSRSRPWSVRSREVLDMLSTMPKLEPR